jgi:hypothetical protein
MAAGGRARNLSAVSVPRAAVAALATVAASCGASTGVASAASNAYVQILNEYSETGQIPPCQFTSTQLNDALKSVDLYGQAYVADFPNAIQAALNDRASGGCNRTRLSRSGISNVEAVIAGSGGGGPALELRPGSVTAATDSSLPAPILILAVLAGSSVLLAAGTALARARGWDPAWAAAVRHSLGEAGYRLGGAFEELRGRRR